MNKRAPKKKSEIAELSEFIRDHMVTKEYLDEKLAPIYENLENHTVSLAEIRVEIRDIRREIENLEMKVENLKGYGDDIRFLYERIDVIEKHLGIKQANKG